MTFPLEHLPPRVHVVIGTRGGSAPAAAAVEALEQRTEGWIAALQLSALSLRSHQNPGAFITRFAGDNGFILDSLVEEVLAHQPQPVQGFLLQTSILDRLTGPPCGAVTGGNGSCRPWSGPSCSWVPLDDNRHFVPEAVSHALAAPDFDRAVHLMELAAEGGLNGRYGSSGSTQLRIWRNSPKPTVPVVVVRTCGQLSRTGIASSPRTAAPSRGCWVRYRTGRV